MYGAPSEHPAYAGRHRHRGVGLHRGLRHQQQPGGHMGSARLRARRVLWRQGGHGHRCNGSWRHPWADDRGEPWKERGLVPFGGRRPDVRHVRRLDQ